MKRQPFLFLCIGVLFVFGRLAVLLITPAPLKSDWVVRGVLGGFGAAGTAVALWGLGLELRWYPQDRR